MTRMRLPQQGQIAVGAGASAWSTTASFAGGPAATGCLFGASDKVS